MNTAAAALAPNNIQFQPPPPPQSIKLLFSSQRDATNGATCPTVSTSTPTIHVAIAAILSKTKLWWKRKQKRQRWWQRIWMLRQPQRLYNLTCKPVWVLKEGVFTSKQTIAPESGEKIK
jgi:hypothetical protein